MSGYSRSLIEANKSASTKSIGVKLGRICIDLDIPVTDVAEYCRISRMTVYNWFKGVSEPSGNRAELVQKMLLKLAARRA